MGISFRGNTVRIFRRRDFYVGFEIQSNDSVRTMPIGVAIRELRDVPEKTSQIFWRLLIDLLPEMYRLDF